MNQHSKYILPFVIHVPIDEILLERRHFVHEMILNRDETKVVCELQSGALQDGQRARSVRPIGRHVISSCINYWDHR